MFCVVYKAVPLACFTPGHCWGWRYTKMERCPVKEIVVIMNSNMRL